MSDLNKIIEDLSSLTVDEAAELSKQLEEKWGVTAATAVAADPKLFFRHMFSILTNRFTLNRFKPSWHFELCS